MPKRSPWGICIHTTGSGVPTKALKTGKSVMDVACDFYLREPRFGPAYVLSYDSVAQVADDDDWTFHVGSFGPAGEDRREQYMSGDWLKLCSPTAVSAWRKQWPKRKHPWNLFPGRHPNANYLGIEMIPLAKRGPDGFVFTPWQHEQVAQLCAEIGTRHAFPDGWWTTSRLVGHEDIGLIDRSNKNGGWDPGWLKTKPDFDFALVRRRIGEIL